MKFNYYGFKAIYVHEMNRFIRTIGQSILSPVISTSLYFVVFGSVIGGYIEKIDGVSYGSLIVPLNFGKNIPNEVLLIDWVNRVNINKPGTINDP